MMADSVGLALLVVLDTLGPAERVSFVLHDVFGMSFDEIAQVLGKTPAASRQLASRARRRVRDASLAPTVGSSGTAEGRRRVPGRRPVGRLRGAALRPRPRCRLPLRRWTDRSPPSRAGFGRPCGGRARPVTGVPRAARASGPGQRHPRLPGRGPRRHRWRSSGSRSREAGSRRSTSSPIGRRSAGSTCCERLDLLRRQGPSKAVVPAATRLGTTIRQASITSSRISVTSIAAIRTSTQWYRMSARLGIMNFSGSEATSASRSSFGNANPISLSSRENAR